MEHYICKGTCQGASDMPMKCGDKTCPMFDKDFEHCDCKDGDHDSKQDAHVHDSSAPSNPL